MDSKFLTNYTDTTFLSTIQSNLRECVSFCFSVSFIKKAGLVLLANDIKAAIERGAEGKLITSTYQNFTDVESLNFFLRFNHGKTKRAYYQKRNVVFPSKTKCVLKNNLSVGLINLSTPLLHPHPLLISQ